MTRYTWHVEDPADDPAALAEGIAMLERRGYRVECDVLDAQMRRRRRDEYLRQALALMPGTPWARCVALEKEISTFEGTLWPRWHAREVPPEGMLGAPAPSLRSPPARAAAVHRASASEHRHETRRPW